VNGTGDRRRLRNRSVQARKRPATKYAVTPSYPPIQLAHFRSNYYFETTMGRRVCACAWRKILEGIIITFFARVRPNRSPQLSGDTNVKRFTPLYALFFLTFITLRRTFVIHYTADFPNEDYVHCLLGRARSKLQQYRRNKRRLTVRLFHGDSCIRFNRKRTNIVRACVVVIVKRFSRLEEIESFDSS